MQWSSVSCASVLKTIERKCVKQRPNHSRALRQDTASYVCNIWLWFFSTYTVSVEPFQCNVLFLCVFVVSFFPLFPPTPPSEQRPVPYRQEGEPGSFQFGRAHDHVSFSCAIPTHPISKTTSQFHQPYSYSIPPLQRSAGRPGRPGCCPPAESGGSALRIPLTGLSGSLCHPRHLAWPGAHAAARSTWWVHTRLLSFLLYVRFVPPVFGQTVCR